MSTLANVPFVELKNKFGLTAFVETGTGEGGLAVQMTLNAGFEKITSCELNDDWALTAQNLFSKKDNVRIYPGPSKFCLPKMLSFIGNLKTLFWLDAHFPPNDIEYPNDLIFPLKDELNIIKNKIGIDRDVIAIDDLRLFDLSRRPPQWSYPVSITREQIEGLFPKHRASVIEVPDVILVLTPRGN